MRRVHANCARGKLETRDKYLKHCLAEARADKDPGIPRWRIFVQSVQLAFDMGDLTAECTWDMVVLIPKGGGGAG